MQPPVSMFPSPHHISSFTGLLASLKTFLKQFIFVELHPTQKLFFFCFQDGMGGRWCRICKGNEVHGSLSCSYSVTASFPWSLLLFHTKKLRKKITSNLCCVELELRDYRDLEIFSGMRTMPANTTRKYIKLIFVWGMEKALSMSMTLEKRQGGFVYMCHSIFLRFFLCVCWNCIKFLRWGSGIAIVSKFDKGHQNFSSCVFRVGTAACRDTDT